VPGCRRADPILVEIAAKEAQLVAHRDNGFMGDKAKAMIVAVPFDAVSELKSEGLASPLLVFRGPVLDAVVTVGTDAAALVSLMQAPDAIRAFAAWVRARCTRSGDSIELSARSGDRRVHLKVDGHVDVGVVADFLTAAMQGDDPQS
jgi:hypothetical protein